MVLDAISELPIEVINALENVPFKIDEDLENNPQTNAQTCLQNFFQKNGHLHVVPSLLEPKDQKIKLHLDDAVYPICSGGWCRSQALWAMLQPYSHQLVVFPAHAARAGWDPYNGRINRARNYEQETVPDEFDAFFGFNKTLRFGFENDMEWQSFQHAQSSDGLKEISQFYDLHYFSAYSTWEGKQGKRRVYVAFSNNAHVVLHRLTQCNEDLREVTVVAIEAEDLISHPPPILTTRSRSSQAYAYFTHLLRHAFDLTALERKT